MSLCLENPVRAENVELSEMQEIILQLKDSFQKFKDDTCNNFNELSNKFNTIDKIITENKLLKTYINQQENKIEILECCQIANDVIINGVPEHKTENHTQLIQKIGKELNLKINKSMINDCHRIGFNKNNERPRRSLVNFTNH